MKKLLLSLCMLSAVTAFAQPFTEGNIIVQRIGDGSVDLSNQGNKVFLDEYTPAGALVRSIEMPSTNVGGINYILNGTNDTEGALSRSPNGLYVSMFGYNGVAPYGSSVLSASPATLNRVVATINNSGTISYMLLDDYPAGGQAQRSAITTNGTDFWLASGSGVGYRNTSSTSTTIVSTITAPSATSSFRTVTIADGNLYASTTIGTTNVKVGQIGTGLPTSTGTAYNPLSGIETGIVPHQLLFFDLDATVPGVDVLYLCDESTGATANNGGIRKYSFVGGTWVFNGKIGGLDKYRHIAASASGNTVTIFATHSGGNALGGGGALVTAVDNTGYNVAPTATPTLLSSVSGTSKIAYRGVSFVPTATALPLSLKSFNAGVEGSNVKVWWSTFNEVNVKDFTIEKSNDAVTYEKVGTVTARNAAQLASYSFTDYNNKNAVVYYRLKMNEKDGGFSYSAAIRVNINKVDKKLSVAPNPVVGNSLSVAHATAGKDAIIKLYSLEGRILQTAAVQAGASQSIINISQLAKGNYVLEFSDASGKQTFTLVRQ
jgi:hypothetical protein